MTFLKTISLFIGFTFLLTTVRGQSRNRLLLKADALRALLARAYTLRPFDDRIENISDTIAAVNEKIAARLIEILTDREVWGFNPLIIKNMRFILSILAVCLMLSCKEKETSTSVADYFNYDDDSVESAGVRQIPIKTPVGEFKVWTKRFGNNPKIKILLLHGGPAMTHEYMECFETLFQRQGFEFYEYDQLGSYYSDQPKDSSLWTTERFVEEVEQVRQAIGADSTNFYVLGNSWGGILAMEYALKYQRHLKGLLVANMVASAPEYGKYADEVLAKQMKPEVLAEIRAIEAKKDFNNPRYMELLTPNFYQEHICRLQEWPDGLNRAMKHANSDIYVMMQGPSEFGISGRLAAWDIKNRLKEIAVPTLMIGARHDTMDPKAMEEQSRMVKKGRYLYCPNGSHLSMWDDQQVFMNGVIAFIKDVDSGKE